MPRLSKIAPFVRRTIQRIARWAVFLFFGFLASACDGPNTGEYSGFVEGQFIRPAPVAGGRIEVLAVNDGDAVAAGDLLFALDDQREMAELAAAEATLAETQSRLQNLKYGRRPEEIAVLEARRDQARAQLELARLNYDRARELLAQEAVSVERRDRAAAEYEAARASVASLSAELEVARLPARKEEIAAAEGAVKAAEANLERARWALNERRVYAPAAGRVEKRYFLAGDMVPAGAPVVALLPADHIKLKFYVPETDIARLKLGAEVKAYCDGCGEPVTARISFIAKSAEFTPPVIYSEKTRAKLMFRVEARAADELERLHPGQPIDVVVRDMAGKADGQADGQVGG
jgi:HlyD family secretion protein